MPRIHQQVYELILNDIALQQVLHTFEFPQLRSLSLQLDQCETFVRCLKGTLRHLATQQRQCQLTVFSVRTRGPHGAPSFVARSTRVRSPEHQREKHSTRRVETMSLVIHSPPGHPSD